jgi:hypothetical protein
VEVRTPHDLRAAEDSSLAPTSCFRQTGWTTSLYADFEASRTYLEVCNISQRLLFESFCASTVCSESMPYFRASSKNAHCAEI